MVGITSYGAYIPWYRLGRDVIGRAWGRGGKGEKAVAYFDEDSVTMGVAAARDCLSGIDPKTVDRLYFASTTSPYKEKQAAAIVASALDLRRDTLTMDFGGSLRAGATAMLAGIDAVRADPQTSVLICAADTRMGAPNGPKEMAFGDGAAAVLLSSERIVAAAEDAHSISDEIFDTWRSEGDLFVSSWEDRFSKSKGYGAVVGEAISQAMKRSEIEAAQVTRFVCSGPTSRDVTAVARKLGFDGNTQVQDGLLDAVGDTGSAMAMMMLVAAMEEAQAGERILFASYGDGCSTILVRVTQEVQNIGDKRGITWHLTQKASLSSYEKYLRWRQVIPLEPEARPALEQPSAVALWRDRKSGLALCGSRCNNCGTVQYPVQRVCFKCRTKDDYEYYCFADKRGTIASFSQDNLAVSMDPPTTICAVDFEGGGRIMCDMTDRAPEEVKVGMPVEMTFRRLRNVGGICDYWWKCKPIRT